MNDIATINGLMDGISVLETNKNELPTLTEDILYNEKELVESFHELYHDEGFAVYSEYDPADFGQPITLLSVTEEIKHENK